MALALLGGGSVPRPGTIYGVGRNYAAHARELGNAVPAGDPVVFLKARTSLRGLDPAPMAFAEAFHHEVELVLRLGVDVPLGADPGWSAVSHVALGLDLTRREVQAACKQHGLPWVPAKSFAGAAVLAPLVPADALGPDRRCTFELAVNGDLRQRGDTAHTVFDTPAVLRYLASLAPLEAGDLVYTGTPEGVGPIRAGDAFRMTLRLAGGVVHDFVGAL